MYCLVISGVSINDLLNTLFGSHNNWHTLVNMIRSDVHNTLSSGSGKTTSLLHDERHGSSLVKKTKLSGLVLLISGVSEYSSVKKGTVNISNHGSNVTRRISLSGSSGSLTPCMYSLLHWRIPLFDISLVERDDGRCLGNLNIRMGKYEFSNVFIKGEHVYTISKGNNKESRRRVQTVSSSNKIVSSLKGVGKATSFSIRVTCIRKAILIVVVDSNDGSGGDSSINI